MTNQPFFTTDRDAFIPTDAACGPGPREHSGEIENANMGEGSRHA